MSDILDEQNALDPLDETPILYTIKGGWNVFRLISSIILLLIAGSGLWFGIKMEIDIHSHQFLRMIIPISQEIRIATFLIIIPIAIITGAILFIAKKASGWYICFSSFVLLTEFFITSGYKANQGGTYATIFGVFFLLMSLLLITNTYRNYFDFKTQSLLATIGIPTALMIFLLLALSI